MAGTENFFEFPLVLPVFFESFEQGILYNELNCMLGDDKRMKSVCKRVTFAAVLIAVLLIMLGIAQVNSYAADTPQLAIGSVSAEGKDTVAVPVTIKNNPGITTICFSIEYDNSVLALSKIKNGSLLGGQMNSDRIDKIPYYCGWINALQKNNCTEDGILATLYFDVKDSSKVSKAEIKIADKSFEAYDSDIRSKNFALTNGQVIFKSSSDGNGNGGVVPNPSEPGGSDNPGDKPGDNTQDPGDKPQEPDKADDNNAVAKDIAAVKAGKVIIKGKSFSSKTRKVTLRYAASGYDGKLKGYQISRSVKKTTGYKKTGSTVKTKWTSKKFKKVKRTYYYKVRGYKIIDGRAYYTKWSKPVKVVIKK